MVMSMQACLYPARRLSKRGFCGRPRHVINASILARVRVFVHVVRDEDDLVLQGSTPASDQNLTLQEVQSLLHFCLGWHRQRPGSVGCSVRFRCRRKTCALGSVEGFRLLSFGHLGLSRVEAGHAAEGWGLPLSGVVRKSELNQRANKGKLRKP